MEIFPVETGDLVGLTTFGNDVGQSDPIAMKLDVSYHLFNIESSEKFRVGLGDLLLSVTLLAAK